MPVTVCSPCSRATRPEHHERCTAPSTCECAKYDHGPPSAPVPGILRWEAPPSGRRAPVPWTSETLAALKEHVGEWAAVADYESPTKAQNMLTRLKRHEPILRDGGGFECKAARFSDKGTSTLYLRYVGTQNGH